MNKRPIEEFTSQTDNAILQKVLDIFIDNTNMTDEELIQLFFSEFVRIYEEMPNETIES